MKRVTRSSSKSCSVGIPPDLLVEIFSYLPVKSLLRFRAISKTWKSIIEDPKFATFHLERCSNNQLGSHLVFRYKADCSEAKIWWTLHHQSFRKSSAVEKFPDGGAGWSVEDYINGLLLLVNDSRCHCGTKIMVWNPSIRKHIYLHPPHPSQDCAGRLNRYLFLGFDPLCNDYKVVNILMKCYEPITPQCVDIFSLKTRCWKTVDAGWVSGMYIFHIRRASFGSYKYWMGMNKGRMYLVCFDFTSEKFSHISLPDYVVEDLATVNVVQSSSCIVILAMLLDGSTWLLKRSGQGIGESWQKLYKIELDVKYPCRLYLKKDDLWVWSDKMVTTYGIKTKIHTKKCVQSYRKKTDYVDSYIESLVLLQ